MRLRLHSAALSDVGRVRRDNQDSGYAGEHLLAVADGVGGAARGDIASSAAIQQLRRLDVPPGNDMLEQLAGAVHLAHNRIADLVEESPDIEGTSTTLTAGLFDGTRLGMAHVGDSRAYLLRDGELRQLTKDHTFVQSLVDEGRITPDEVRTHPHRNLILRAVDGVHEPEPDIFSVDLQPGDRLLLCSDGCSGVFSDAELSGLLAGGDIETVTPALVKGALDAGSSDNVTVIVVDVVDADAHADAKDVEDLEETAPLVVGAAAATLKAAGGKGAQRRRRAADERERQEEVDPEALRYAPRPPRRFAWVRRVALVVGLLVLVWILGSAGYAWTQTQYFVGTAEDHVAIYKGVEADVPGLDMHHVVESTALVVSDLPAHNARQVRDGMSASSLTRARGIVQNLRTIVCPPKPPAVTPTKKPTRHASNKATGKATASTSPRPHATMTPTPTASPSATDCSGEQ